MKKLALILMVAIFTMSLAIPAYACGGKTAGKDGSATCAGKATCEIHKSGSKDCPSHPGCVCPNGKANSSKASADANGNMAITPAVATSNTKTSVDLTGESGCPMTKSADAKASSHSCTAAERAKCGVDKKEASTGVKLQNGHPAVAVSEAMKCEKGSMVAFLAVDKMTCQGCVDHVTKTLGTFDGVCAVDVNLKKASATVVFHNDKVKTDDMVAAINKAGYVASMKTECTDDMKAVFGDDYKEKCQKSCANMCKGKQEAKQSES
jgi:copper ion binding protein